MSDRRMFRWATSARLLTGAIVATGAVVAVVAGVTVPWPTVVREPVVITATPDAAATVLTCTGPLLALGRDADAPDELAPAAVQRVTAGTQADAEPPVESELEAEPPTIAPRTFTAPPQDGGRVDVAATGSATVAADDLEGFAASACRPPLMESWLAGGSTTTGSADLVLLANPGDVAATVDLTVYGTDGPQIPPGGAGLVIAPRTQIVVPLAGLALGEDNPVIRVSATGSPVVAALQASITRTLVPGGVDQIGAIAAPELTAVIPGVRVARTPAGGGDGDEAAPVSTLVRVLAPASATTVVVTATRTGATAPALEPARISLQPGVPLEVELADLPAGEYTIRVEGGGAAVVAAVWQATGFGEGDDFAWYTAAPAVSASTLFATPAGPIPGLAIVNTSTAARTVSIIPVDGGNTIEFTIEPGSAASARLAPRIVYELVTDGDGIRASLSLAGDGALASVPVWPADAAARPIVVYP